MWLQARLSRDQGIRGNFGEEKGGAEKDPKQLAISRRGLSGAGKEEKDRADTGTE